jgi:hypothetical protein
MIRNWVAFIQLSIHYNEKKSNLTFIFHILYVTFQFCTQEGGGGRWSMSLKIIALRTVCISGFLSFL